jgi:nucleotide-binding universal stress UspA family protein
MYICSLLLTQPPDEHIRPMNSELCKREQSLFSHERTMMIQPRPWSGKETVMSENHALKSIPTKILLPIDFSPSSKTALEVATDLALHFHAELFLVNVIPFITTFASEYIAPQVQPQQEAKARAEHHLAKAIAVLTAKGIKAGSSVEVGNDIVGDIMEVVEREHIDMVVISTHGISGWHPLVFGSIAEKVIKLVQCPLLLLRSAKPDSGNATPTNRSLEWW